MEAWGETIQQLITERSVFSDSDQLSAPLFLSAGQQQGPTGEYMGEHILLTHVSNIQGPVQLE